MVSNEKFSQSNEKGCEVGYAKDLLAAPVGKHSFTYGI